MPRPKTKDELLDLSQDNFQKLNEFIDGLDAAKRRSEFPPGTMNRNICDVLAHLHEWHLMMLSWYEVGMSGEKPEMPAKGYTWNTTPDLNRVIWERYKNSDFDDIRGRLNKSHDKTMDIISSHTNDELFEKKRYKWTGSTSVGQYFVSATSSHYDWALKLIKKAFK